MDVLTGRAGGLLYVIIDGMDRPGGELNAQRAVIKLHEDLVQERNRRKTDSAASLTAGKAGV